MGLKITHFVEGEVDVPESAHSAQIRYVCDVVTNHFYPDQFS